MKRKMLWGSATASYQCEGAWDLDEKAESMWDRYLHENGLENGDVASDHYHHYEEDIRMMAEGGQNAYRFSLSWPRIIRDLEGNVNEKGLAFYDTLIDTCHRYHIEPFVTIYHWDLPQYLEDIGGWQNIETAYHFEKYCETVFRHFNGKVRFWSTFNEPKWFIFSGYMSGNYPPCHRNIPEVIRGSYNVMFASALGVRKFREMKTEGEIGLVASYQTIYGLDESTETLNAMRHADNYCNNWQVDTACLGEFPSDMVDKLKEQGYDLSFAKEEELQIIRENTVDFIGINYYSPMYVKPYTDGETLVKTNNQGKNYKGDLRSVVKGWFEVANDDMKDIVPHNPWGMFVYPQGLYDALTRVSSYIKQPIYVTENGYGAYEEISNDIDDQYRIDYIREHIRYLLKAKEDGVDVNGYFVWSPFDLYSWKNGCEKRYGLVAVDFDNDCRRIPKHSYYWYKSNIENDFIDLRKEEKQMRNIVLVCNGGMSTSILANRIKELGGDEVEVNAYGEQEYSQHLKDADVVLIGPQIRYLIDDIRKRVGENVPVASIEPRVYGAMNAQKVLEMVDELLKDSK